MEDEPASGFYIDCIRGAHGRLSFRMRADSALVRTAPTSPVSATLGAVRFLM